MTRFSRLFFITMLLAVAPADAAPPVVTSQPDLYRTFRGEAIRLPVVVNSALTQASWRLNNRTISTPLNTTLHTVSMGSNRTTTTVTLVVPNATPADSGNYVAQFTNRDGTTSSRTIAVTVADEASPLESWTPVLPGTVSYRISSLAQLNGRIVAGAANSTIHVSSDGKQWQQAVVPPNPLQTVATQPPIRSILGHGGRYFAFAGTEQFNFSGRGGWASTDLLNWEFSPNVPRTTEPVVSNGQRMLVMSSGPDFSRTLVSSADGVTWERAPVSSPFRTLWPQKLIAFKGSFFALVAGSASPLYRSGDGVNWTAVATSVPDGIRSSISFGKWVEFNDELLFFGFGRIWKSSDGIAWSEAIPSGTGPLDTRVPAAVFTGLGRLWISDFNGNCWNSTNLLNWQYLPSGTRNASPPNVVVGTRDVIVSPSEPSGVALIQDVGSNFTTFPANGITSTAGLLPTAAGMFAQTAPFLRFSEDGETWKTTNAFRYEMDINETIAYGNGRFVRQSGGFRQVSQDGLVWQGQSPPGISLQGEVAFGNGRFLTLFESAGIPSISWSADGITWSDKVVVPAGLTRLVFANGVFWAYANQHTAGSGGAREYRYATSSDGESWQARTIPLPSNTNLVNVHGPVVIAGRVIFACADASWWLASDDGGNTWNRLDTGYGFLRSNLNSPLDTNDFTRPVIHKNRLLAASPSGDMIASSDGRIFSRVDGPGSSMATHSTQLFAVGPGGVFRNGTISRPQIMSFGLAVGASPVRGGINGIGIVITDYKPGDRIEFRVNGQVVSETNTFYAHYAWNVSVLDEQTLVVSVIRAAGGRATRSWTTGAAIAVRSQTLPPGLPQNGRLAYQQESAGNFYHITPEGVLRRSVNLLDWTSETLPGLSGSSPQGNLFPRIITRKDGARLLSVLGGLWTSPPGSVFWTAVENFPRQLNGATYHFHAGGSHFTFLHHTDRLVDRPDEFGGGEAYVYDLERLTSTDGITWTSHGLLPTVGSYQDGISDGTTLLWIEDEGFDPSSQKPTPARLWRLAAAGVCERVEPIPDLSPFKVVHLGGKWIVLGGVGGDSESGIPSTPFLLVSDNTSKWDEGVMPAPGPGIREITAYGNGLWIGRDDSGYVSTLDFRKWTPLPMLPFPPVWVGNRWVNSEPNGSGPIDHHESQDLINWRLISATWPGRDSTVLTVTGDRLVTTLDKGLFTMDAAGKWTILSGRKNITVCQFWNGAWLLGAADGGVGIVHEGVSELWQNPLNAPQPASSRDSELVMGFVENGSESIAFSNRALYATTDGRSWSRRYAPTARSVASLVRLGGLLIVETFGSFFDKRIDSSSDGGRTWIAATIPVGNVNYLNRSPSPYGPYGLYVEQDSAFYIGDYDKRHRSDDGRTWSLLPSNTDANLPRPIRTEQGTVQWTQFDSSGFNRWQFRPFSGQAATSLTPSVREMTPQGAYFRGRMVMLNEAGLQVTPLANLQVNFPHQPGHTVQSGDAVQVAVEVRNTGFDKAWFDTPVVLEVGLPSGGILGSVQLTGSLESRQSLLKHLTLVMPRPLAGGRHHLVARLHHSGGLPVDGVPEDDQTVSSEPLLRVSSSQLAIGSMVGGQLLLAQSSDGTLVLETGDTIRREVTASLLAIPDRGQRFVGWNDRSLGTDTQVAMAAVSVGELVAYFAPGSADYRDLTPHAGPPQEDRDYDGTPNVIEFLLGSDLFGNGTQGWSMICNPDEAPCIEFVEQLGITSHSLAVTVSDDLRHWKTLGREYWTPVSQRPTSITWRVPLGKGTCSFVRLEALEL